MAINRVVNCMVGLYRQWVLFAFREILLARHLPPLRRLSVLALLLFTTPIIVVTAILAALFWVVSLALLVARLAKRLKAIPTRPVPVKLIGG